MICYFSPMPWRNFWTLAKEGKSTFFFFLWMVTYFVNFLLKASILKLKEKGSMPISKNCSLSEVQKASSFDIVWKECICVLSTYVAGIRVISAALFVVRLAWRSVHESLHSEAWVSFNCQTENQRQWCFTGELFIFGTRSKLTFHSSSYGMGCTQIKHTSETLFQNNNN